MESDGFSDQLDEMWKGLKKFWPRLLVLVLICTVAFFLVTKLRYEPQYTASSTFTVSASTNSKSTTNYNETVAKQLGKVFPYLLSSDAMTKLVAEDLGMDSVPGIIQTENLFNTIVYAADPSRCDHRPGTGGTSSVPVCHHAEDCQEGKGSSEGPERSLSGDASPGANEKALQYRKTEDTPRL